jgi:hypothetical protein
MGEPMNDGQWDSKLKGFLKKTGEDFKRFGNDVKGEAQKLMAQAQDPKRQEQVREGLKEVGTWAKKTAEEVATLVEKGVKKAEVAFTQAGAKAKDFATAPVAPDATPPNPVSAAPQPAPEPSAPQAPAKKTVGGGKKAAGKKKTTAKKTIGKKAEPPKGE